MADAGDLDGGLVLRLKEHAVVAAPEPEAGEGRPELLHIAAAADQVPAHAGENLHGSFTIDGA